MLFELGQAHTNVATYSGPGPEPLANAHDALTSQVQLPASHKASQLQAGANPRRIITGPVLLAKHPVAHRGDVRVVNAVHPRYRAGGQLLVDNYVNVVVFSQQGHRPLSNMLSGSDLVRRCTQTGSVVSCTLCVACSWQATQVFQLEALAAAA